MLPLATQINHLRSFYAQKIVTNFDYSPPKNYTLLLFFNSWWDEQVEAALLPRSSCLLH